MEAHDCTFGTHAKIERKNKVQTKRKRLQHFDCSSDDILTPIDPLSDVHSNFSVALKNCFVKLELLI